MAAGTNVLARLGEHGYATVLEGGRLKVRGAEEPRPELERLIANNRDALAAAVLLSDPPPWLVRLLNLYTSGHETEVRRVCPATGTTKRYPVRASKKNIAAAVATEIGISPLKWERILPEVEGVVRRRASGECEECS